MTSSEKIFDEHVKIETIHFQQRIVMLADISAACAFLEVKRPEGVRYYAAELVTVILLSCLYVNIVDRSRKPLHNAYSYTFEGRELGTFLPRKLLHIFTWIWHVPDLSCFQQFPSHSLIYCQKKI